MCECECECEFAVSGKDNHSVHLWAGVITDKRCIIQYQPSISNHIVSYCTIPCIVLVSYDYGYCTAQSLYIMRTNLYSTPRVQSSVTYIDTSRRSPRRTRTRTRYLRPTGQRRGVSRSRSRSSRRRLDRLFSLYCSGDSPADNEYQKQREKDPPLAESQRNVWSWSRFNLSVPSQPRSSGTSRQCENSAQIMRNGRGTITGYSDYNTRSVRVLVQLRPCDWTHLEVLPPHLAADHGRLSAECLGLHGQVI